MKPLLQRAILQRRAKTHANKMFVRFAAMMHPIKYKKMTAPRLDERLLKIHAPPLFSGTFSTVWAATRDEKRLVVKFNTNNVQDFYSLFFSSLLFIYVFLLKRISVIKSLQFWIICELRQLNILSTCSIWTRLVTTRINGSDLFLIERYVTLDTLIWLNFLLNELSKLQLVYLVV